MDQLYQLLRESSSHNNIVCTVIKGMHCGEKAFFSEGRLLWETGKSGFYSVHAGNFEKRTETGLLDIDGNLIFTELVGSEKKLVICGGGHVSIPVIKMGLMLGFHITVLEDRPKFAGDARAAGAQNVICDSFANGLKEIKGDSDTFFVIVTRGHRYDQECLEIIAKKRHAYIGMIGSRLRVRRVMEALIESGSDPDVLSKVHSPIGLSIGAETPEEIAVSIMAEIIQVKNEDHRSIAYPKKIIRAILDDKENEKVLTTIITRKGSAPRAVGTKMLVYKDGTTIGTIGGGCVESDVIRKAMRMIAVGNTRSEVYQVDMTGIDAENEGMVCGGVIDILFEKI